MIIDNGKIYLSGNHPSGERWLWHQMSIEGGDSLATYEVVDPENDYTRMYNLGMVKFDDRYCIFGPGQQIDNADNNDALFYFMNHNGTLDSLVHLFSSTYTAPNEVQNRGDELVVITVFNSDTAYSQRIISSFDEDLTSEILYVSEGDSQNFFIPSKFTILEDGTYVYNKGHEFSNSNTEAIRAINPDGTIKWSYSYPPLIRWREYYNLITLEEGNILGVGVAGISGFDPSINRTPWIVKFSSDGERLWEKIYYKYTEGETVAKRGRFFDVVELEAGDLLLVGNMQTESFPDDILIARLDSNGCQIDGCDDIIDITDLVNSIEDQLISSHEVTLYPNPTEDRLMIKSEETISHFSIMTPDGQTIKQLDGATETDVSDLPKGLYFVVIYFEDGVKMEPFMKL